MLCDVNVQVRVLELEQSLQQERIRLGTLRKKRYELDGVKDEEENEADSPQEEVRSVHCEYEESTNVL